MIRSLAVFVVLASTAVANAQAKVRLETLYPDKASLMHGIEVNEAALRNARSAHASSDIIATAYSNLGALYEDAAVDARAFMARN